MSINLSEACTVTSNHKGDQDHTRMRVWWQPVNECGGCWPVYPLDLHVYECRSTTAGCVLPIASQESCTGRYVMIRLHAMLALSAEHAEHTRTARGGIC
jgi:hypothetical protein